MIYIPEDTDANIQMKEDVPHAPEKLLLRSQSLFEGGILEKCVFRHILATLRFIQQRELAPEIIPPGSWPAQHKQDNYNVIYRTRTNMTLY